MLPNGQNPVLQSRALSLSLFKFGTHVCWAHRSKDPVRYKHTLYDSHSVFFPIFPKSRSPFDFLFPFFYASISLRDFSTTDRIVVPLISAFRFGLIMNFKSLWRRRKKSVSSTGASVASSAISDNSLPTRSQSLNGKAQIAELEQIFKKLDVNGDGKISSSELGSMMNSLGQTATEEELQKMIREVDADGDGFIDFQEFVQLNTEGVDSEEVLENLKDAFSVYDIDGNGLISAEELYKVMKSLNDECSLAECRKMISGVDRSGDGMIRFD